LHAFSEQHAVDAREVERLVREIDSVDPQQFQRMKLETLTAQQTLVRQLRQRVDGLTQQYASALEADERQRDHLREDRRAIEAARAGRPHDRR
jgi:hypothetical protein